MSNLSVVFKVIFTLVVIWVVITSMICWVKTPKLSEMEVALRIPSSFVLDFDKGE